MPARGVIYLFIYLSYCMQPEGLWHSKQEEVIQTKGITQNKNYTIQNEIRNASSQGSPVFEQVGSPFLFVIFGHQGVCIKCLSYSPAPSSLPQVSPISSVLAKHPQPTLCMYLSPLEERIWKESVEHR